ncbi:bifunctional nicotinamidase/pyrazinamidase [Vibrio palustris]|uniref:Nicotinamidase n=1 Tax=Vibrio palustris TaxID=1918946 RepID=A0A1R4B717_9VIBR|nr:bifunctional nicotinamidase/pyrazinamidase [Vibrio palustris]SJL84686.1 nicotinamidase/pyrazinamidase [Vibrio palustris]
MKSALILVDIQNDFSPDGALPVEQAFDIIPVVNKLMGQFDHVVATQDWHPEGHGSFASTHNKEVGSFIDLAGVAQIMWPDHCVQGSAGSDFIDGLNIEAIEHVIYKGTQQNIDSYSGFFDNQRLGKTGLADYLHNLGVTDVYITGLATDYCVKFTALDAVELGFNTWVVTDACRGVNMQPQDCEQALLAMQSAGCRLIVSDALPA